MERYPDCVEASCTTIMPKNTSHKSTEGRLRARCTLIIETREYKKCSKLQDIPKCQEQLVAGLGSDKPTSTPPAIKGTNHAMILHCHGVQAIRVSLAPLGADGIVAAFMRHKWRLTMQHHKLTDANLASKSGYLRAHSKIAFASCSHQAGCFEARGD